MKLHFTFRALDDLRRLRAFIAREDPSAARRISQELANSIRHLIDHPRIGHPLDADSDVRMWVAGRYVVHYLSSTSQVTVLRVWHGREGRKGA